VVASAWTNDSVDGMAMASDSIPPGKENGSGHQRLLASPPRRRASRAAPLGSLNLCGFGLPLLWKAEWDGNGQGQVNQIQSATERPEKSRMGHANTHK
jgi:hypothetical protein